MTNSRLRTLALGFALLAGLSLTACDANRNSSSAAANPAVPVVSEYYYADFNDVPIPKDMKATGEATVIQSPGGVKTGLQIFKGRVQITSLTSAMNSYMAREGWSLCSALRGNEKSIHIFEKPDRYCILYVQDGLFNTEMLVSITPKLNSGSGLASSYTPQQTIQPLDQ